jgi:predicted ABC-type sugar transport system permease subunit
VIALFTQSDCAALPDVNVIVGFVFTVIVPLCVAVPQLPPFVVTKKLNGEPDVVVGVPLIVTVLPFTEEFTPVGKPVTVAPVAPPPSV